MKMHKKMYENLEINKKIKNIMKLDIIVIIKRNIEVLRVAYII